VAAYMPNLPQTTAAFLACVSVGAIWFSPVSQYSIRPGYSLPRG
jgi:acyl-coenzyme A synthetase/AMP-(fatty) acid ligase